MFFTIILRLLTYNGFLFYLLETAHYNRLRKGTDYVESTRDEDSPISHDIKKFLDNLFVCGQPLDYGCFACFGLFAKEEEFESHWFLVIEAESWRLKSSKQKNLFLLPSAFELRFASGGQTGAFTLPACIRDNPVPKYL
jgi:hypothetical protein